MKLSLKNINVSGRSTLDLLIEFTYLAAIFLVPLCFATPWFPTYNIFELNKLILFEILFWLLLFLTIIKIIFYWPFVLFKDLNRPAVLKYIKKYFLIPLIFLAGLGVTLFLSINPTQSFYGSYFRQAGYVSYLFYVAWFGFLVFNLLSLDNRRKPEIPDMVQKRINRIILAALWSGALVSLYGLLQIFNLDFLTWPEPPYLTHRTISTFGQPNFLASFLLFIIPLAFYWLYTRRSLWSRLVYGLISLMSLVCLFFTASRGAFIALLLTLIVFLLYLFTRSSLSRRFKLSLLGGIGGLIIIGLFGLHYVLPGRLSSFTDYQSGSFASRLNFYGAAVQAIKDRPIFGYGLETSEEAFIRYYAPDWGVYGNVGASTDRAHNLILDIILTTGLWGLVFFAALYYYFFRLVWCLLKNRAYQPLALTLGLGGLAYLLSLLFSFSVVTTEIYFWLFLALLVTIRLSSDLSDGSPSHCVAKINSPKIFLAILTLIIIIWPLSRSFKTLFADHYYNKLYYTLDSHNFFTAQVLGDDLLAAHPNPVALAYYNRFWGSRLNELLPSFIEKPVQIYARYKLVTVLRDLPDHGYQNLTVKALSAAALGDYAAAANYFKRGEALAPHWPIIYLAEGRTRLIQKDAAGAKAAYQNALVNLPNLNSPFFNADHRQVAQSYYDLVNMGLNEAARLMTASSTPLK